MSGKLTEAMGGTFNHDPDEVPHDIGNYLKADREIYVRAAEMTGSDVAWSDEATHHMPAPLRDDYGSLWSSSRDLSEFWRCVERLRSARAALSRGADHE